MLLQPRLAMRLLYAETTELGLVSDDAFSRGEKPVMLQAPCEHSPCALPCPGVGLDFNTELAEAISKVKGALYFSVHSPGEFQQRLVQDFDFAVTVRSAWGGGGWGVGVGGTYTCIAATAPQRRGRRLGPTASRQNNEHEPPAHPCSRWCLTSRCRLTPGPWWLTAATAGASCMSTARQIPTILLCPLTARL